jgi:coproporphyrinogen III oxidase
MMKYSMTIIVSVAVVVVIILNLFDFTDIPLVQAWILNGCNNNGIHRRISIEYDTSNKRQFPRSISSSVLHQSTTTTTATTASEQELILFNQFVEFLIQQQTSIIDDIETTIEVSSGQKFTRDTWGIFAPEDNAGPVTRNSRGSGGITRVIQSGTAIEKGACSLTVIRDGILSAERASSILGRQQQQQQQSPKNGDNGNTEHSNVLPDIAIQAGDTYSAVALSMVLHSRNPMVPTFRSDVRMFQVRGRQCDNNTTTNVVTWLGGGADLTPYYLYRSDIQNFHQHYHDLCQKYSSHNNLLNYESMKQACDNYFYLPARQEHRGTGGIFFDDIPVHMMGHRNTNNPDHDSSSSTTAPTSVVLEFGKEMTQIWMKSWFPIVQCRNHLPFSPPEKHWQKLRRGRYLEFNLLYDVSRT